MGEKSHGSEVVPRSHWSLNSIRHSSNVGDNSRKWLLTTGDNTLTESARDKRPPGHPRSGEDLVNVYNWN